MKCGSACAYCDSAVRFFVEWHHLKEVTSTFHHPVERFMWGFQRLFQTPRSQGSQCELGGEPHWTTSTNLGVARNLWSPCLMDRVVGQTLTLIHWHWVAEKTKRAPALTLGKRVWFYYLFIAGFVILVCYFQLMFHNTVDFHCVFVSQ